MFKMPLKRQDRVHEEMRFNTGTGGQPDSHVIVEGTEEGKVYIYRAGSEIIKPEDKQEIKPGSYYDLIEYKYFRVLELENRALKRTIEALVKASEKATALEKSLMHSKDFIDATIKEKGE